MILLRRLLAGFRSFFHKTQVEREFDDELRAFLETAVEQKMSAGERRPSALPEWNWAASKH